MNGKSDHQATLDLYVKGFTPVAISEELNLPYERIRAWIRKACERGQITRQKNHKLWTEAEKAIVLERMDDPVATYRHLLPGRSEDAINTLKDRIRHGRGSTRTRRIAKLAEIVVEVTTPTIQLDQPFDTPYGVQAIQRPGPVGSPPITLVYLPSVYG